MSLVNDISSSQAASSESAITSSLSQPQTLPSSQSQPRNSSSNDSQDTTATRDTADGVFSPPASDSGSSIAHAASSEDSQLLAHFSHIAAQQEKIGEGAQSRKRMADGNVKHSSISPVRMPAHGHGHGHGHGHSRNTSTVSMASNASSRVGEVTAELKAKLSYAMLKVNNGWQSHSIDEVESLASQASPTSSTSTIHGRHGASASPRMQFAGGRQSSNAVKSPIGPAPPHGRTHDTFWGGNANTRPHPSSASPPQVPTLAPPASIQPRQPGSINSRRNSNPRYTPTYLSHSQASPHTPAQPSSQQSTPGTRYIGTPHVDPILFSPPSSSAREPSIKEREAMETLVFMSSPGNSANMKHTFPSSIQPRNGTLNSAVGSQRTALPTSRLGPGAESGNQRKSLPTGRPHGASQGKRVGFSDSVKSPCEMDVDEPYSGSPRVRGTPQQRRKANGGGPVNRPPPLSVPASLSSSSRPRPTLGDDDIERMLDRVAADDSSDSEGEITLPTDRRRQAGGVVGV